MQRKNATVMEGPVEFIMYYFIFINNMLVMNAFGKVFHASRKTQGYEMGVPLFVIQS